MAENRTMTLRMIMSVLMAFFCWNVVDAQLSTDYYAKTCPNVLSLVNSGVQSAVAKEKRMGASLLRLHFHDCFVNGCDGSVLLDGANGEKSAVPNNNSARGFEVIDSIKSNVESACPSVVSCADILAIIARDSVVALGGPSWNVLLGRRDARSGSLSGANNNIPSPNSSLSQLISKFSAQGLSAKEMVVLAGGHTIGQARCFSFRSRIYNDADIDASFASSLKSGCPSASGSGDQNLAPLDLQSPTIFDNNYHSNLLSKKGLLHSDQQIFSGGSTDAYVRSYASNQKAFFSDFAAAMIKMGNISPLTGSNGEIRKNCRKPN